MVRTVAIILTWGATGFAMDRCAVQVFVHALDRRGQVSSTPPLTNSGLHSVDLRSGKDEHSMTDSMTPPGEALALLEAFAVQAGKIPGGSSFTEFFLGKQTYVVPQVHDALMAIVVGDLLLPKNADSKPGLSKFSDQTGYHFGERNGEPIWYKDDRMIRPHRAARLDKWIELNIFDANLRRQLSDRLWLRKNRGYGAWLESGELILALRLQTSHSRTVNLVTHVRYEVEVTPKLQLKVHRFDFAKAPGSGLSLSATDGTSVAKLNRAAVGLTKLLTDLQTQFANAFVKRMKTGFVVERETEAEEVLPLPDNKEGDKKGEPKSVRVEAVPPPVVRTTQAEPLSLSLSNPMPAAKAPPRPAAPPAPPLGVDDSLPIGTFGETPAAEPAPFELGPDFDEFLGPAEIPEDPPPFDDFGFDDLPPVPPLEPIEPLPLTFNFVAPPDSPPLSDPDFFLPDVPAPNLPPAPAFAALDEEAMELIAQLDALRLLAPHKVDGWLERFSDWRRRPVGSRRHGDKNVASINRVLRVFQIQLGAVAATGVFPMTEILEAAMAEMLRALEADDPIDASQFGAAPAQGPRSSAPPRRPDDREQLRLKPVRDR